jgi:hypothetical protein
MYAQLAIHSLQVSRSLLTEADVLRSSRANTTSTNSISKNWKLFSSFFMNKVYKAGKL